MKRLGLSFLSLLLVAGVAAAQSAPVITSITAVHVDARQRQVPTATAPTITLPKATDASVSLIVRNSDNTRLNIAGAAITLTVRKAMGDTTATISRLGTITDAANGVVAFDLAQSDTSGLALGDYVYSIEAVWSGGAREQLVKVSPLKLVPTVGLPSDTPTTPTPSAVVGYGLPAVTSGEVNKYLQVTGANPTTLAWSTVSGGGGGGSVTINTTSPLSGGGTGSTFTLSCPTCVLTSGTQTIGGAKTFSLAPIAPGISSTSNYLSLTDGADAVATGDYETNQTGVRFFLANEITTATNLAGWYAKLNFSNAPVKRWASLLATTSSVYLELSPNGDYSAAWWAQYRSGAPQLTLAGSWKLLPEWNGDDSTHHYGTLLGGAQVYGEYDGDKYWRAVGAFVHDSPTAVLGTSGAVTWQPVTSGEQGIIISSGNVSSITLSAPTDATSPRNIDAVHLRLILKQGNASHTWPSSITGATLPAGVAVKPSRGLNEIDVVDCTYSLSQSTYLCDVRALGAAPTWQPYGKLYAKALGSSVSGAGSGQDGYCLRWNNSAAEYQLSACPGAGGGGSITFTAPTEFSVTGSPGSTIGLGWASASGNKVIASPSDGTSGAYAGRALVAADIPSLAASKITSGQLAIAQGGTGAATTSQNFAFIGPTSGAGAPSFRALVAGDIPDLSASYQPLDGDLTAISALSSTGLVARTASNTYVPRTITGSSPITVTNGDGVLGAPALSIADGAIANVKLANSSVTLNTSSPLGGGGSVSLGGTLTLTCATCLTASPTTTGDMFYSTAGGVALSRLAAVALGSVLASGGVGAAPQWLAPGGDVTGAIGALTVGKIQGKAVGSTSPTDGMLLIGRTSDSSWVPATLTAGSNVTITNAGGAITIASSGGASGYATVQNAGSALTQRSTLNCSTGLTCADNAGQSRTDVSLTNTSLTVTASTGLTGGGSVSLGGSTSLAVAYGTTSTTATVGNDSRLPPAPSSAGRVLYDSSTAWTALAAGTSTQVLHGGTTPSWAAVSLTSDVSGTLGAGSGGTGLTSYAVGDLLYASGSTTIAKLADVATGQVLVSGGVTTAPAYSATPTVTTITGSTSVLTPLLDANSAAALNIGTTNATSIVLKKKSSLTPGAVTSGVQTDWTITSPANTGMTASTEVNSALWDGSATWQWATGALTTQRHYLFKAPTYGFVGASTITNTATVAIDKAPVAGTNATLTNKYALWVQADKARFDGGISMATGQTVIAGSNTLVGTVADKLNPVHLAHASQAIGDILYADSTTTMTRLADVAAGSYLRSGGVTTAPVWSTLTLPNAATSGDLLYASGSNAIGNLGIGLGGRLLASNDAGTAPAWGHPVVKQVTINSGTTGAGNVDTTVLAIPAGATSSTNSFLVTGVVVRVLQAMVGGGGITLTCGATAGGTEFLASQSITSSTGVGSILGLTTAQQGSAFTSANQYNALINGSTSVICRSALTGTVSTQAIFNVTVMGVEL